MEGAIAGAESAAQQRQTQKMEAVSTLAVGVAHDFNNLLATILGSAELAELRDKQGQDVHEYLSTIQAAAERASGLAQKMSTLSIEAQADAEPTELCEVIETFKPVLQRAVPVGFDITIETPDGPCWALASPVGMEQVLLNLVINACLLYTSPSPRDATLARMPSSA